MPNTINNQPLFASLQLTDYLAAWQGSQSPPTRKLTVAGLAAYYLALTGGTITGDTTFSAAKPKIAGNAGTVRAIQLLTGSTVRWQIDANSTAESGTNAGSNFELWSYTDAGAQLTKVLAITRSSGAATFGAGVTTLGTLTVNPSSGAPVGVLSGDGSTYISVGTSSAHPFLLVSNNIERARIDLSGNLLFATTNTSPVTANVTGIIAKNSPGASAMVQISNPAGAGLAIGTNTSDGTLLPWFYGGVQVASIAMVGSGLSVAYNTGSDYRIKVTYGPADVGALIDAVPVHDAAFKADLSVRRPMFLAHELQAAAPWAVHGDKDAVDENGAIVLQQVDHPSLVPTLWAELQSLRRRVAELERGA